MRIYFWDSMHDSFGRVKEELRWRCKTKDNIYHSSAIMSEIGIIFGVNEGEKIAFYYPRENYGTVV